jgi:cytoskeleton protein RodZ
MSEANGTDGSEGGGQASSTNPGATGARLRAAREAGGLSIEDVASKLKLSPRQINAIEIEDWDALPERTFTRGFMRSYARLVGVDEASLQINATHPAPEAMLPPTPRGIGEISSDDPSSRSSIPRWAIPAVLISLLAAGIAWFVWHDMPMPVATSRLPMDAARKSAEATASISTNGSAAAAESANAAKSAPAIIALPPVSNGADATPPPATAPLAVLNVPAPSAPSTLQNADPALSKASDAPSAAPASPPVSASSPATASPLAVKPGQKRLSLTFTGRSWTEIRSKGDVVFSEMASVGTREVAASTPISFVVGNASNVTITIDGKPYDFSGSVRNEVARFRIE